MVSITAGVPLKHDYKFLRRVYKNNSHDAWFKELRARCRRAVRRIEKRSAVAIIREALS